MSARDRETAEALVRLAASLDGAVLGLGTAAVAVASWVKYLAISGQLRLVASAATAPMADLRSLLPGRGGAPRLAAVRGYVRPKPGGTVLRSQLSGEYGVITKHTQMCLFTEWRGIFGWTFDLHALLFQSWKEQIVTSFRTAEFVLASSVIGNPTGMVFINIKKEDQPIPLTTVFHKLIPIETTPYTLFQTIIGNGYPIALLDEEKILPIGKELTAIGLCRAKDEGNVEISPCPELPFFLSELTKDEMQAQLASRARILFWASIVLGSLSVCLVGHAIYRGWKRIKLRREARQARQLFEEAEDAVREDDSSDDEAADGQLCVVCLRKRRKAAFIPCGHLVCCCKCAIRMENEAEPLCPMCRQDIRYMIRIYDS
ncbi:hypothetical protein HU200_025683 [Digitaria exilis]|uniref:RING-type E3 ubiquitin transferase n=1 Tax=Digitaria exilis TaxID=1010633 RepID=A0A835C8W5_9POAL|nr:hypothetical protein HU200_025683 [Digitaria exilis]CAB3496910.1 unnamed protein product [Digitaria exilis]